MMLKSFEIGITTIETKFIIQPARLEITEL